MFNFEKIICERKRMGLSQEKLGALLRVSRQAIQKWESGGATPDLAHLISMADVFGVTLDSFASETTENNTSSDNTNDLPDYNNWSSWESYSKTLKIEYKQSIDEGKDISKYASLFDAVASMPEAFEKDEIADILYKMVRDAKQVENYKYTEPSDYEHICRLCSEEHAKLKMPEKDVVADKVYGGWLGRICGCYLGKPIEGILKPTLDEILKRTNNYPISRYISREEITEEVMKDISFPIDKRAYPSDFGMMPVDDDTNYILIGYIILKKFGRDFTPNDVMNVWIERQGKNAYCTAERVAYRNFVNGFRPPVSAVYKNAYREYIGAQIRGDFFGYVNPCDPKTAASMAFRDASISHVKNGIYGEMWVSAMIAAAFGTDDIKEIIKTGLAYIPKTSRLYESINEVITDYENGVNIEDVWKKLHANWNEKNNYDWCHTISNAIIVAASLLYGEKDYGKTVCLSVSEGFDTDCNAATAGSILGVALGGSNIPEYWGGRVNDTLCASIFGFDKVSIREMAKKTLDFFPENIK